LDWIPFIVLIFSSYFIKGRISVRGYNKTKAFMVGAASMFGVTIVVSTTMYFIQSANGGSVHLTPLVVSAFVVLCILTGVSCAYPHIK